MPVDRLYHILCSSGNKVMYEGRFLCPTRAKAIELLREKVGRSNLSGLTYSVTEFPIEVIREVIEAIMRRGPMPQGDLIPFQKTLNPNHETETRGFAQIREYRHNPHKPKGAAGVKRRLGEL